MVFVFTGCYIIRSPSRDEIVFYCVLDLNVSRYLLPRPCPPQQQIRFENKTFLKKDAEMTVFNVYWIDDLI